MAVWQVEFAIVPRSALATAPQSLLRPVTDTNWWASGSLPADYTRHLGAIALLAASGIEELQTWGEREGNRVDVWSENGRATRITAHVDVRRLDSKFGAMLLQFARVANAVFIRRDGLIVEPSVGAFGAALRTSEAWRYANDPAAFLASHAEREDDDK